MSNNILIRNISNLTDARYFAAMGVDWMSIKLSEDPASFSRWHTMREWVSGVKLAVELVFQEESLVAKTMIDAQPDGLVVNNLDYIHLTGGIDLFLVLQKLLPQTPDQFFTQIIPYDPSIISLERFLFPHLIYLEANWNAEMINDLKKKKYQGGICFQAGNEITVGVRDYSELDALLELIRN